ncbi:MAG: signal peptidase I [Actinomycetota bacterium]
MRSNAELRETVRGETRAPATPALHLVPPPPPRRPRWRIALAVAFAAIFIAGPMLLHAVWDVTASAVLSDSMRPAFSAGDAIVTRAGVVGDLAPGDVVVLADPEDGTARAHRVIRLAVDGGAVEVVTKGDANPAPDQPLTLPADQAVRIVIARIPALGRIAGILQRPTTLIVGAGLLLAANVVALLLLLFPRSDRTWGPPAPRGGGRA